MTIKVVNMSANEINNNEKEIVLEIGDVDVEFVVTRELYNRYLNSLSGSRDKVTASHNFLMGVVGDKSKTALKDHISKTPGSEMDIVGLIISEYTPDTGIRVKKRKSTPVLASETVTTD